MQTRCHRSTQTRRMIKRGVWAASALPLCVLFITGATPGAADRTLLKKVDPPCVNDADCAAGQFCTSGKQNPAVSVCAGKVRFNHVTADRTGLFLSWLGSGWLTVCAGAGPSELHASLLDRRTDRAAALARLIHAAAHSAQHVLRGRLVRIQLVSVHLHRPKHRNRVPWRLRLPGQLGCVLPHRLVQDGWESTNSLAVQMT